MEVRPDGSFVECTTPCPECGNDEMYYYKKNGPHIAAYCVFCNCFISFCSLKKNLRPKWTREVKERDRYTCQRCGKILNGAEAKAHHKLPVWFMPELEFDTDNGICLCKDCHKQIHGYGGSINEKN